LDANVRATNVTEKTVPATPIMAPEIVESTLLAESALPMNKNLPIPSCETSVLLSKFKRNKAKVIDPNIISTGTNQKVDFSSFQKKSSFFIKVYGFGKVLICFDFIFKVFPSLLPLTKWRPLTLLNQKAASKRS
jgi:hypothetical protein